MNYSSIKNFCRRGKSPVLFFSLAVLVFSSQASAQMFNTATRTANGLAGSTEFSTLRNQLDVRANIVDSQFVTVGNNIDDLEEEIEELNEKIDELRGLLDSLESRLASHGHPHSHPHSHGPTGGGGSTSSKPTPKPQPTPKPEPDPAPTTGPWTVGQWGPPNPANRCWRSVKCKYDSCPAPKPATSKSCRPAPTPGPAPTPEPAPTTGPWTVGAWGAPNAANRCWRSVKCNYDSCPAPKPATSKSCRPAPKPAPKPKPKPSDPCAGFEKRGEESCADGPNTGPNFTTGK